MINFVFCDVTYALFYEINQGMETIVPGMRPTTVKVVLRTEICGPIPLPALLLVTLGKVINLFS